MPAKTNDPKIPVSTGVTAEMLVHLEDFAAANGFMRGEKANLSGLLLVAAANYTGFNLPAEEKAATVKKDPEEAKRIAREAEQARREAARARVAAIREAQAKSRKG